MPSNKTRFILDEEQSPKFFYNLLADLKSPPPPPLHPGTLKPIGPDDLAPLFPMALIEQEVSLEREIEIPAAVREAMAGVTRPSTAEGERHLGARELAGAGALPAEAGERERVGAARGGAAGAAVGAASDVRGWGGRFENRASAADRARGRHGARERPLPVRS